MLQKDIVRAPQTHERGYRDQNDAPGCGSANVPCKKGPIIVDVLENINEEEGVRLTHDPGLNLVDERCALVAAEFLLWIVGIDAHHIGIAAPASQGE